MKLNDTSLLETRAYINGVWIKGDVTFAVTNPATGEEVAQVTDCSVADVQAAIDGAFMSRKRHGPQKQQKNVQRFCANGLS